MSKTWRTCKRRYLVGREWHSFRIREKPGTCGGCAYFSRIYNSVGPSASGTCRAKPNIWTVSQCKKACKKYNGKEEDHEQEA